jgi:hypothetical protein
MTKLVIIAGVLLVVNVVIWTKVLQSYYDRGSRRKVT